MRKTDFNIALDGLLYDVARKRSNPHNEIYLTKWFIRRLQRIEDQLERYEEYLKNG